jgi:hypothetical protein
MLSASVIAFTHKSVCASGFRWIFLYPSKSKIMSLNFETKNWKFEFTLEALHIHPIHKSSDETKSGSRRESQRTTTNNSRLADYFLRKPILPAKSSIIEQE